MASIGINIYSFHIHDANNNKLDLSEVVENKDIIDIFQEFAETKIDLYEDNTAKEQIYKVVDYEVCQQSDITGTKYLKYLYGRIQSGNYGIETEIVDKITGDIAHKKTVNQADMIPFDFVIALPEDPCNETIIALQTVSRYSIKSLLVAELNKYIKKTYGLGYVYFGTIYPREFVQKYIKKGKLGKMRLIRNGLPEDMASMYGIEHGYRKAKKETTISSPSGFSKEIIEKITNCVQGNLLYTQIVQLGDNEDYDDIKLDFKLAGKQRTISLKNLEKVVVSEDITKQVDVTGGNPRKESIKPVMVGYVTDYLIEKGLVTRLEQIKSEMISSIEEKKDDDNEGDNN